METDQTIAQTIREALDLYGYTALRRECRLADAVLHRMADPATVGLPALFRVRRAYEAAKARLAAAPKPKPSSKGPRSAKRKRPLRLARRVA
jgi:hypothetical protein